MSLRNGNKATGAIQQACFRLKTFNNGVMLELGQRSTDRDVWVWILTGAVDS